MKNIYLLLFAVLLNTVAFGGTYYWSGTTPITSSANWSTNQSGTGGTQPSNFSTSGDVFWVANSNASTTLTAAWTLGTGVTLHIGSGTTTAINGAFWRPTIVTATGFVISGGTTIVEKRATLQLGTSASPTYASTQGDSSNIIYTAGGSIPSGITYGNLIISAGSPSFATGTINIQNSLYVTGGTLTMAASASASYTINITDSMVIASTGAVIVAGTNAVSITATIGRDLIWRGTAAKAIYFQSSAGAPANTAILQVNGNVISTGGASNTGIFVDWGVATSSGTNMYIGIKGNYTHSGQTRNYLNGNFDPKGFVFNGTGTAANPQIINYTTSGWSGNPYSNITINSGTYVKMAAVYPIGNGGSTYKSLFRVLSGGTLDCGTTGGVSGGVTTSGGGFQADPGSIILTGNVSGFTSSASISATLTTAVGLSSGAIYGFNGTAAQATGTRMPATVKKLIINNTAGVTLSQATSDSILEFTAGKLDIGSLNLTVVSSVTGASTSAYVNTNSGGALIKPITGLTSVTYEVGDTSYAPVNLTLSSSGTAGSFSVKSRSGQHPNYGTSCFANSAYDSHYWTIASISATGPATVNARFNYNSGDIVGGSNTSFIGQRYAGSAWSGGLSTTNNSSPYYSSLASIALASLPGDYQFSPFIPTINPSVTTLSFSPTSVGSTSPTLTFTILACSLSPSTGSLTVTAPANFKVFDGSSWVTSYNIAYTGSAVASPVTVSVQFAPTGVGLTSGNVSISGGSVSTPATVSVSGNAPARYYSKATGNLNILSNWGLNTDGSGAAPSIFTGGDTLIMQNNLAPTIGAAWNVTGSVVNVGNSTDTVNFTIPSAFAVTGTVNVTANAKMTITNTTIPTLGTLAASSTVIFNGSSAQAIPVANYGHLKYTGTSAANHLAGNTRVLGNYTISSGTVYVAQTAITDSVFVSGDMIINGTGALVMANATGATCAPYVGIGGNLTCTSTASTEIQWQLASGAAPTAVMQVNGNVSDNNTGSTDANFIDWGNATALQPNSYLALKGNLYLGGRNRTYLLGNFSPLGIVFNGTGTSASPQTITWLQTHSLAVSNGYCNYTVNSGTYVKMASGLRMGTNTTNVNWQNIFRVKSGGTLDCDTFTISDGNTNGSNGFQVDAGGTLITAHPGGISASITAALSTGTGLSTGANYTFNGTVNQTTSARLPATVNKLTVSNTNGVTLSQNLSAGTLEFISGKLYTSIYTITPTSSVTGAGTSSYVYANATGGAMLKPISGLTSLTYEVGDSTYAPVNLTLSSAGTGGSLGVRSTNGVHPSFFTASIASTAYAKHYWTLTNVTAAGPSSVVPTFNYNNSGDIIGGSNASFIGRRYSGSAWGSGGVVTNNSSPAYSRFSSGIALGSLAGDYQFGDTSFPRFTYYSKSSGNLDDVSTWGTNTDGTGTNPASFTNSGDSFIVQNNLTPTIGANWVISGVVVQVGNGISAVNLTVPSSYTVSGIGVVIITANATLTINSSSLPNLGYMAPTSTLVYNGAGAVTFPATSYGTLIFGGASASHAAGTTTVSGNYTINAGTVAIPSTATISSAGINVLGTSTLNIGTTTLPTLGTISDTSTVVLSGSGAITIPARNFGNLSYTGSGTANHSVGTTAINGSYTITTGKLTVAPTAAVYKVSIAKDMNITGTGAVVMAAAASASCIDTVTINGDLNVSSNASAVGSGGGTNTVINFQSANGVSATSIIQVNGNVNNTSIASNFLDWGNVASGTSPNSLGIKGNFSHGGAGRFYYLSNGLGGTIRFNGTTPQNFTYSNSYPSGTFGGAGSGIQYANFTVMNGATVVLSGNVPLGTSTSQPSLFSVASGGTLDLGAGGVISSGSTSGGFQVLSGGTVKTANSGGFPASITAPLNATTGYGAGAKYVFDSGTITPFASAISTNAPASVTVNAGTVKANFTFSPSTTLTVASGATLDMDNLVLGGAFTPVNTGTIRSQSTSTTLFPSGLTWGGTIEYYAPAGGQTVVSATYNNLVISNTSGTNSVVAGGTVAINGDLTLNAGCNFSDNNRPLTLAGHIFGTGIHTTVSNGRISMTGPGKTISAATLGRLHINSGGIIRLAGSPTITKELAMANGNITMGANNLTLGATASVTGGGTSSTMIIPTGTGRIIQMVTSSSAGVHTYPVGDSSGNYSPFGVILTSGSYGSSANLSFNLKNTVHPNNANINNYLKRYWHVSTSGFGANTYSVYGQYAATDIVGSASAISMGKYPSALPWVKYAAADTINNLIATTSISDTNADFTGITTSNPSVSVTPSSTTICIGASVGFSASGSGDPSLTYSWAPAGTLSAATGASVTATPTVTGTQTYTVTITDGNGITNTQTATINVLGYPSITIGANPSVCQPTSAVTLSYGSATGSPSTYSIVWSAVALADGFSNVSGATLAGTISLTIPTGADTTYSGAITVSNGSCSSTSSYPFSVSVYAYPTATITSAVAPCSGYSTNVIFTGTPYATVTYNIDGGSPATGVLTAAGTYSYSTGAITASHLYKLLDAHNPVCTTTLYDSVRINPMPMAWTGATSSDWNTSANWSCGFVPGATDDVSLDTGAAYAPAISTASSGTVHSLAIRNSAVVIVNATAVLNIKGNFTNNGSVAGSGKISLNGSGAQSISGFGTANNLELNNSAGATIAGTSRLTIKGLLSIASGTLATGDSLVLSADSSGTARVDSLPTGTAITGQCRVQTYIQGGRRAYRFWSHPFSGSIGLSQVQNYIDVTGTGGATNGFTYTASNAPSAFRYNPLSGNSSIPSDPGWKPFTSAYATADSNQIHRYQGIRLFVRGEKGIGLGYAPYTPSPVIIGQWGTLNTGVQTVALAKGSANPYQEYNMVGNPYASPVDIGTVVYNARIAGNVVGPAYFVWNPTLGSAGQFQAQFVSTVAAVPYYLPACSSFQIRAAYNGSTLTFAEGNKGAGASVNLLKEAPGYVLLKVYDASYHPYDMLYLQFNDAATDRDDSELDALKPFAGADLNFYSVAGNGHKMIVDARPYDVQKTIPLGISAVYEQEYIIKAESVVLPGGAALYLHDKLLNQYILLQNGEEYRFAITNNKNTQGDNRFELSARPANNAVPSGLKVAINPNPATDEVNISFTGASEGVANVQMFNMDGAVVYQTRVDKARSGAVKVSLSGLPAGAYIMELTSGNEKVVQRLAKE